MKDYARLLKTAYLAIKEVDPSMQVLVAGMTYYWDWEHGRRRYLDRLLEIIAADPEPRPTAHYFDGVIYHLYFNPRQTVDVLDETRQTLSRYGMAGKADLDQRDQRAAVGRSAGATLVRAALSRLAGGAGRVRLAGIRAWPSPTAPAGCEVYKLRNSADHPESIEPFGLLRADNSPRPAFDAYRTATTYLGGFRSAATSSRATSRP